MISDFTTTIKKGSFKYLWISQLLSQLTIQLMNFLLLVRIFEETRSTIATSMIWIAYALPAIIVGPFASAFVDISDRRKVLMVSNILQSLTILVYALAFEKSVYLSFGVVLFYSLFNQFYVPAESASLPALVKKQRLPQANGIFLLTQQFTILVGFGAAGILNSLLGYRLIFLLAATFLFLAFISVSFLPKSEAADGETKFSGKLSGFFNNIMEGYNYIRIHKNIFLPVLMMIGLQVAVTIITTSLPIIAVEILASPANAVGILVVVPALAGAIVGTVGVSRLLKGGRRKKWLLESSLFVLGLAVVSVGVVIPLIPLKFRELVAIIAFFLTGYSFVGILIPIQTYLQEVTPDEFRGRLFGNMWFMSTVATVFPVIFSATLSEVFGVKPILVILGLSILGVFFYSIQRGQKVLASSAKN